MPPPTKILSLNCQGLRSPNARLVLFQWLMCISPDIVCLQETHAATVAEMRSWVDTYNATASFRHRFQCLSSPGSPRSSGVAILFRSKFQVKCTKRDEAGRLLVAEFSGGSLDFQVMCLYAPNSRTEGRLFFESLYPAVDPDLPLLMCGDFNAVVDPCIDRFGCNPNSPWANNWASTHHDLMNTFALYDTWRACHPGVQEYTWRRANGTQGSRLDMIWLSARWRGLVRKVEISPFLRSDHHCVYLEWDLPVGTERGPGLWKFNTSLLTNAAFCGAVENFWCGWRAARPQFLRLSNWYEAGKVQLLRLIRDFSRRLAQQRSATVRDLTSRLATLQRQVDAGCCSSILLDETKAELDAHLLRLAQGAQLRARLRDAEEGERSTSYFLRQEKVRGQQRLIHAVRRSDGSLATRSREIQAVWRDFYFNLLSSQPLIAADQLPFLESLERTLTSRESALCEGALTLDECTAALSGMSLGKTPGVDGLPAEFFHKFWAVLGPDLVEVYNACYHLGSLPRSLRCGVISLLFKRGDCLDAANWRPITLLCVDYKIAAKALAGRLLLVIASVVSPDQTCGVPGRFSGENIRLLEDVAAYSDRCGVAGAIVSLDQEKAFDRVDFPFLMKVMEKMGFGPSFRRWVRLLYTEVYSAVSVNGFLTEYFPVTRGVRQGCPLSPLLYILAMESLACAVRTDPGIDGFPLPCGNRRVKLSQYADDTSCLVASDSSLVALFNLFARYERASGAKLNRDKCCGLLLGPWRTRSVLPVALQWSSSYIVVLGARISVSSEQDWAPATRKLQAVFHSWRHRRLSYQGRAVISCVLGASRFWYLGSVVPVSSQQLSSINRILFNFIWNGKGEWISRLSLCMPRCKGGLGVVDVARKLASLQVMWVKRYLVGPHHPWKSFFQYFLRRAFLAEPVARVFTFPRIDNSTLNLLPAFYQCVLRAWLSLRGRQAPDATWVIPSCRGLVPLSELSSRMAYGLLSPQHQHRCVRKFALFPVDWPFLWSDLSLLRYDRAIWSTNWLAFHGVLPTSDRMSHWGVTVNTLYCHCRAFESHHHIFVDCPLAHTLLEWFDDLLRRLLRPRHVMSVCDIRFGFSAAAKIPAGFRFLLAALRHYLWVARNAWQFEGTRPNPLGVIAKVVAAFRFISLVQQRRATAAFLEQEWFAGGLLKDLS